MRRALGVAVFSGMLGVTFFGIFLTPVFYYVIQWFAERRAAGKTSATAALLPQTLSECNLSSRKTSNTEC